MNLPFETLVMVALIGAAVGWLASQVASSETGFGLPADVVAGLVGAFAGAFAAPRLGLGPDGSELALLAVALVGAAIVVAGARYLADVWASQVEPRADAEGRPLPPGERPERRTSLLPVRAPRISEEERSRLWMRDT